MITRPDAPSLAKDVVEVVDAGASSACSSMIFWRSRAARRRSWEGQDGVGDKPTSEQLDEVGAGLVDVGERRMRAMTSSRASGAFR